MTELTNEHGGAATGGYVARWLSENPDAAVDAIAHMRVARGWFGGGRDHIWRRGRLGHLGRVVEVRPYGPGCWSVDIRGETRAADELWIVEASHSSDALHAADRYLRSLGWGLLGEAPTRRELCSICAGHGATAEGIPCLCDGGAVLHDRAAADLLPFPGVDRG